MRAEPLIPTPFPDLLWQRGGTDLFDWKGSSYLLVVDYYSRFIEVAKLSITTADSVIIHMKSIFARHGIADSSIRQWASVCGIFTLSICP